jgi:CheY-like chemotaxis protein
MGGHFARPVEILLVEDNHADVELTREGLREGKVRNNLSVVNDGEQALMFLRRVGPYRQSPRPDMILLDLNMPRKDGREVLEAIRADPELEEIPVVVLTTSSSQDDVRRAYKLKANCYITKPVDFDQFLAIIRKLDDFWFTIVRLPSE